MKAGWSTIFGSLLISGSFFAGCGKEPKPAEETTNLRPVAVRAAGMEKDDELTDSPWVEMRIDGKRWGIVRIRKTEDDLGTYVIVDPDGVSRVWKRQEEEDPGIVTVARCRMLPVPDLFGENGFALLKENGSCQGIREYYRLRNGMPEKVVEGFGNPRPTEDFVVDLDGDGVSEFVCNNIFFGNGAPFVYVYRCRNGKVEECCDCSTLLGEEAEDAFGQICSTYDPDSGQVRFVYGKDVGTNPDGSVSFEYPRPVRPLVLAPLVFHPVESNPNP